MAMYPGGVLHEIKQHRSQNGELIAVQQWMRMLPNASCGRLFEVYCECMGEDLGRVEFWTLEREQNYRLYGSDTPRLMGSNLEKIFLVSPLLHLCTETYYLYFKSGA